MFKRFISFLASLIFVFIVMVTFSFCDLYNYECRNKNMSFDEVMMNADYSYLAFGADTDFKDIYLDALSKSKYDSLNGIQCLGIISSSKNTYFDFVNDKSTVHPGYTDSVFFVTVIVNNDEIYLYVDTNEDNMTLFKMQEPENLLASLNTETLETENIYFEQIYYAVCNIIFLNYSFPVIAFIMLLSYLVYEGISRIKKEQLE